MFFQVQPGTCSCLLSNSLSLVFNKRHIQTTKKIIQNNPIVNWPYVFPSSARNVFLVFNKRHIQTMKKNHPKQSDSQLAICFSKVQPGTCSCLLSNSLSLVFNKRHIQTTKKNHPKQSDCQLAICFSKFSPEPLKSPKQSSLFTWKSLPENHSWPCLLTLAPEIHRSFNHVPTDSLGSKFFYYFLVFFSRIFAENRKNMKTLESNSI